MMKALALLLLALPLTACAHNPLISEALADAKAHCAMISDVYPNDANYLACLNRFAVNRYGMELRRLHDGSLTLVTLLGGPAASDGAGPPL